MAKTEANCEEVSYVVSDFIDFLNASPTAFHAVGKFLFLSFPFGSREMIIFYSGFPFSFWSDLKEKSSVSK